MKNKQQTADKEKQINKTVHYTRAPRQESKDKADMMMEDKKKAKDDEDMEKW